MGRSMPLGVLEVLQLWKNMTLQLTPGQGKPTCQPDVAFYPPVLLMERSMPLEEIPVLIYGELLLLL